MIETPQTHDGRIIGFMYPRLRDAVLAVVKTQRPDGHGLGAWLRGKKNRIIGSRQFCSDTSHHQSLWWVEDTEAPADAVVVGTRLSFKTPFTIRVFLL